MASSSRLSFSGVLPQNTLTAGPSYPECLGSNPPPQRALPDDQTHPPCPLGTGGMVTSRIRHFQSGWGRVTIFLINGCQTNDPRRRRLKATCSLVGGELAMPGLGPGPGSLPGGNQHVDQVGSHLKARLGPVMWSQPVSLTVPSPGLGALLAVPCHVGLSSSISPAAAASLKARFLGEEE